MLRQSFRVDEDSPVCPGSLFLSAAEEAPHHSLEPRLQLRALRVLFFEICGNLEQIRRSSGPLQRGV